MVQIVQPVDTITTATGPLTSNVVTFATDTPITGGTIRIYLGGDLDSSTETASLYINGVAVQESMYVSGAAAALKFFGEISIPASLIGENIVTVDHRTVGTTVNVSYANYEGDTLADGYMPVARNAMSRVYAVFILETEDFPAAPSAPTPTGTYFNDFSTETTGSSPTGWSAPWNAPTEWMVYENPECTGGKSLVIRQTSSARWVTTVDTIPTDSTYELLVRFRINDIRTNAFRIYMGVTGAAGAEQAFFGELFGDSTLASASSHSVKVRQGAYSTTTNYGGGVPYPFFDFHEFYQMRMRVHDNYYSIKLWQDGQAEPTDWTVAQTDADIPMSGGVGIGGYYGQTFYEIDAIYIAYGGWPSTPFTFDPMPPPITDRVPAAPTTLSATISGADVVLDWDAVADADGYRVYRDGVLIGGVETNTYTDISPPTGEHTYEVYTTWGTP